MGRLMAGQAAMHATRAALRTGKPCFLDFAALNNGSPEGLAWPVIRMPGLLSKAVLFDHHPNRHYVAGRIDSSDVFLLCQMRGATPVEASAICASERIIHASGKAQA